MLLAAGTPTGPVSGQPAALSEESKSEILSSSSAQATGQTVPGKDNGDKNSGEKVKSQKERTSTSRVYPWFPTKC